MYHETKYIYLKDALSHQTYHESVDSIIRDERDVPLTQYITNAGISRATYTITHFKPPSCSTADFQSNECIRSLYSAILHTRRTK